MSFLLFLLDDRRIRIPITDKWIRMRIREAQNTWILRIRIRNTTANAHKTLLSSRNTAANAYKTLWIMKDWVRLREKLTNWPKIYVTITALWFALIKKKIKFSSYIRKFRGIGCKVIYD
jgi:hypothetical protein